MPAKAEKAPVTPKPATSKATAEPKPTAKPPVTAVAPKAMAGSTTKTTRSKVAAAPAAALAATPDPTVAVTEPARAKPARSKGSRSTAGGAAAVTASTAALGSASVEDEASDPTAADDSVAARLGALATLEPEVSRYLEPSTHEPAARSPEPDAPTGQPERWYEPAPASDEPEVSSLEPEPPAYGFAAEEAAPATVEVAAEEPAAASAIAAEPPVAASTGAAVGAAAVQPAALAEANPAAPTKFDRRLERMRSDPNSGVSDATAIGAETALFDCPHCSRPLPVGTSRCPECNTRLIGRRTARRVGTMAAAALVAVVAVAVGMTAVLAMSGGSSNGTATVPSHAPSASGSTGTAAPTVTVTPAPATPGVPAEAAVALSGTTLVNTRITQDGAALARTLADKKSQTIDVARAIRVVAADAQQGLDMSGRLAPWTDAATVKSQLDAFYQGLADTARDALRASLTDDASYRQAGARLVTEVRKVDDVDAASRTLATSVGLQLPALGDPGTVISPPPAP
jgi:hypothetical protein